MKYIATLFLALSLIGCKPGATEEERRLDRVKEATKRVEQLKAEATACDNNGGIKDIYTDNCSRSWCRKKVVECTDGMSKIFNGDFERAFN